MTRRQWLLFLSIILIISAGFIVYFNSLHGEFIWDEEFLIINNEHIKAWSNLKKIFLEDIGAGSGVRSNFYRPLQMLTYMMDYSIWRFNVVGYHLTNVLLHISVSLAVYWFIYMLCNNWGISFLVSIFFVTHPVHTEVVSYIPGRSDSLTALFLLLSTIFYIKRISSKGKITFILMILTFILALISKEISLILFVLLVFYSALFKKKILIKDFLSILSITLIYIILRMTLLKFPSADMPMKITLLQRIPGFFVAIFEYCRVLLAPFNLHMEHTFKIFRFTDVKVILGILILVGIILFALKRSRTNRLVTFSVFLFLLPLLPVSNLYPINAYMAERWLYLPSIGFFLILANGLTVVYRKNNLKVIAVFATISLLFFYSYLTVKQNNYWKDRMSFNKMTLRYVNSPKIYHNLCKVYRDTGDFKEAILSCEKAIGLDPKFLNPYYTLATIYENSGNLEDALMTYKRTLKIYPNERVTHLAIGDLYDKANQKDEAIRAYSKAIEIDSGYLEAYNNLASIYADRGEVDKAITLWNKILKLNPNFATAHFNLAVFYFSKKEYVLAVKHCKTVLRLGYKVDPKFLKLLEPYWQ